MNNNPLILLALVLVMAIPLFLQKRRNDKVRAQLRSLQTSLTPGLPVITAGGQHGVVSRVNEQAGTVDLTVAPGVVTTWELSQIVRLGPGASAPAVGAATVEAATSPVPAAESTSQATPSDSPATPPAGA